MRPSKYLVLSNGHTSITCLLVQSLGELVDWWRDLQPGLQNCLLPLETDVLGPFDKVAQVPLGLDVLADAERLGALLKERVDHTLDLWLLDSQGSGRDLLSLLVLFVNHDEDSGENPRFGTEILSLLLYSNRS